MRETHERNVLVWLVANRDWFWAGVVLGLLLVIGLLADALAR